MLFLERSLTIIVRVPEDSKRVAKLRVADGAHGAFALRREALGDKREHIAAVTSWGS